MNDYLKKKFKQRRPETKAQARLRRRQEAYDTAAKKNGHDSRYDTGGFHRPGSSKKSLPRGRRMKGTGGRPASRQSRIRPRRAA